VPGEYEHCSLKIMTFSNEPQGPNDIFSGEGSDEFAFQDFMEAGWLAGGIFRK
jgi:hypothetical protein